MKITNEQILEKLDIHKTVKQLSKELNVSKETLYRRLRGSLAEKVTHFSSRINGKSVLMFKSRESNSRCEAINKSNGKRCENNAVIKGYCMTHYRSKFL